MNQFDLNVKKEKKMYVNINRFLPGRMWNACNLLAPVCATPVSRIEFSMVSIQISNCVEFALHTPVHTIKMTFNLVQPAETCSVHRGSTEINSYLILHHDDLCIALLCAKPIFGMRSHGFD